MYRQCLKVNQKNLEIFLLKGPLMAIFNKIMNIRDTECVQIVAPIPKIKHIEPNNTTFIGHMWHLACVMFIVSCVLSHLSPATCHLALLPRATNPPSANSPTMQSKLVCKDYFLLQNAKKCPNFPDFRELKQHITSPTITSQSLPHHFLCLIIYLHFLAGLVLLSTNLG